MLSNERKTRFLELLEPVYPRLSRYALAMTRNKEEARDLVGEAVLVGLERFETLRSEDGFAGFMFRIVSRTYKRWHFRERLKAPFQAAHFEMIVDSSAETDRGAEVRIVMEALNKLPAKTKETLLLFDVADLSLEAVREIQGGSLSGVKSRLGRGHEALREMLGIEVEENSIRTLRTVERTKTTMRESEEVYAL